MITLVPFEAEHLIEILRRNRDAGKAPGPLTPEQMVVAFVSPGSVAYTFMFLHVPIACAGIVNFQFKRGEAWLVVSDTFYRYRRTVLRVLKRQLPLSAKEGAFRRVQATSFTEKNDKYFRFLEFKREGTLAGFGPGGEDTIMYSRIFNHV